MAARSEPVTDLEGAVDAVRGRIKELLGPLPGTKTPVRGEKFVAGYFVAFDLVWQSKTARVESFVGHGTTGQPPLHIAGEPGSVEEG